MANDRLDDVLARVKKQLGGDKDATWATLAVAVALTEVAYEISRLREAIENAG